MHFNYFANDFDDPSYIPWLDDQWLTQEELAQRSQVEKPASQKAPSVSENRKEEVKVDKVPEPEPPDDVIFSDPEPEVQSPLPAPDTPDPEPDPVIDPVTQSMEELEPSQPSPILRRSTRVRRAPERFTFNKKHGYWSSKVILKTVIKGLLFSTSKTYDYCYIYALMMDHDRGTLEGMIPNFPFSFKASTHDPDTSNIGDALSGPHREQFLEAMEKEVQELEGHNRWEVLKRSSLPEGANILPSTWAFKIKRYPDSCFRKFKAHFCVRGDKQIEGVEYEDNYAPVVSWTAVRMLMRIALKEGWKSRQVDYANAFVQADIKEDVYIALPPGFRCSDQTCDSKELVMKLNRSLYGLVQAPLHWFNKLKEGLNKHGFTQQSDYDPCLFFGDGIIALVYVDNVVFFGPDLGKIDKLISDMKADGFGINVEDDFFHFLGVDITKSDKNNPKFTLKKTGLIDKILRTVDMVDCNGKDTPAMKTPLAADTYGKPFKEKWEYSSVVGMLFYLCSNSRPDIQFALHQCARFNHCPRDIHATAIKRIYRYLKA